MVGVLATTDELAGFLNLSTRRIQQIIKERGIRPVDGRLYHTRNFLKVYYQSKGVLNKYEQEWMDSLSENEMQTRIKEKILSIPNRLVSLPLSNEDLKLIQDKLSEECDKVINECYEIYCDYLEDEFTIVF
jgi:hypothetical protein